MSNLKLNLETTAVVVIDMQEGIVGLPCAPYSGEDVLAKTQKLVESFRRKESFVVLVNVGSRDGRDVLNPLTDNPAAPARPRPEGWDRIRAELGPEPMDHLVTKHQWGAFFGTDLDLQLRRRGIDTIVLCGIATDIGVETTAREAFQHGYHQIFVEDATTALSEETHTHTFKHVFPRIGRIRTTDEVLEAVES